jgi:hypothetical protein
LISGERRRCRTLWDGGGFDLVKFEKKKRWEV